MAVFSALRQTTFSSPVEGRDNSNLVEGLTIRRTSNTTNITEDGSRVATIKKLSIKPTANIATAYGLYVESPTNAESTKTVDTVYSAFIDALKESPTGTVTKSYALGVERPAYGGTVSIQSKGDVQIGDDSSPQGTLALQTTATSIFNLLTSTVPTINFGSSSSTVNIGKKDSAANTINIGTGTNSTGAKSISIGTGSTGGTTAITIGSTTGTSTTTVQIDGTITNAVWDAGIIPASKGGTGKNNGTNTLTINNSASLKSSNNLTFTIPAAGSTMSLPEGSTTDTVLTDKSSATVTNKSLAFGTGGDNTFRITHDGTSNSLTTITGVTDGNSVLATKAYVDSIRTGLDVKDSVRAASTTNIASLSGIPSNFDGLTGATALVDGDRVLLKNQSNNIQNGIWVVHSGAWTRPIDYSSASFTVSSFSSGANVLTLATAATGTIEEGQVIIGTGIASGTYVLAHGDGSLGSTITISASTTGSSDGNAYKTTNVSTGAFVFVESGSSNNDSGWVLNTDTTYPNGWIFVGIDGTDWTKFSTAGTYSAAAGGGLTMDGSGAFSLNATTQVKNWIQGATADNLYAALTTGTTGTAANVTGRSANGDAVVFSNNPTISTGITVGAATFNLANNATTLNVGSSSATINVASTITDAQTVNIATGATTSTNIKAINIGTSGLSTSTTNIILGGSLNRANNTITLNAASIKNASSIITMFDDNTTTSLSIVDQSGIATINIAGSSATNLATVNFATGSISAAQTGSLFTGATGDSTYYFGTGASANTKTKALYIGTEGLSGSITEVTIGSANGNTANFVKLQAGTSNGTIHLNASTIASDRTGTVSLLNTNVTTLNIGGAATTVTLGSTSSSGNSVTINSGTAGTITLNGGSGANNGTVTVNTGTGSSAAINLNSPLIDSSSGTIVVLKTPTDITIGQSATGTSNKIKLLAGSSGGTITLDAGASTGTINLNAGTISSSYSTVNLLNATVTALNIGGAATSVSMGSSSGSTNTFTINVGAAGNATNVLNLNADTINSNRNGTVSLFNTGVTGLNLAGDATAIAIGSSTGTTNTVTINAGGSGGAITLAAGSGASIINLNAATIRSSLTTVNLLNTTTTTVNFGGAATTINVGPSANTGTTTLYGSIKGYTPLALGSNSFASGAGNYRKTGMYMLYGSTTDTTQQRLTSAGSGVAASGSNIPVVPAGSAWFSKVYVSAFNSTANEGASWEVTTMFRRSSSGNVILIGDPFVTASSDSAQGSNLQITIQEDTTNQGIDIRVQNTLAANTDTVYWTAVVQTVEVG